MKKKKTKLLMMGRRMVSHPSIKLRIAVLVENVVSCNRADLHTSVPASGRTSKNLTNVTLYNICPMDSVDSESRKIESNCELRYLNISTHLPQSTQF